MLRDSHIICEVWCCEETSALVCDAVSFGTWFLIRSLCRRRQGRAVRDVGDEGSPLLTKIRTCSVNKAAPSPTVTPPRILIAQFSCTCFYQQKCNFMYVNGNGDNLHTAV